MSVILFSIRLLVFNSCSVTLTSEDKASNPVPDSAQNVHPFCLPNLLGQVTGRLIGSL